jgi:hypothetical protein
MGDSGLAFLRLIASLKRYRPDQIVAILRAVALPRDRRFDVVYLPR